MTMTAKNEPKEAIDARGKWVILDTTPLGVSLLSVGSTDYPGISPRNWLTEESRSALLAKLKETVATGEDFTGRVSYRGYEFDVVTKAIWSPDRRQVVGVTGIYDTLASNFPAERLIGTWQWRVCRNTGKNVGEDASIWDQNLFDIYGMDPQMVESNRGPAGQWLNKLVSTRDRNAIKLLIDSGVSVNNRDRHLLSYEVIFGYGTPKPSKKQMSMTARAYDDPDYPDALMLLGFSREVALPTEFVTPGLTPVPAGLIVDAIFALASNRAFAVVDLLQEVTAQTSASWTELGLLKDFEGNIAALAHPEDKAALEQHLQGVADGSVGPTTSSSIRLRTTQDEWRRFELVAAPVDAPNGGSSRYITASLAPWGEQ
jgi:hypothetical protein